MRSLFMACLLLILGGCNQAQWQQAGLEVLEQLNNGSISNAPLSLSEIDQGLREALRISSERVITQVGQVDGFYTDRSIRIPLPEELDEAYALARKFGLEKTFDDIELKLNRAAELAAPRAKQLFWNAIRDMRMADVRDILDGPDDAATQYFKKEMTPELTRSMRPIIDKSLDDVGAIRTYKKALQDYNAIPFAPQIDYDLTDYALEKGIDGIFHYLAVEEAAIRRDPVKRTTTILQRVFGSE